MMKHEVQKREEHEEWLRERQEKKRQEHGQQVLDENKVARRSASKPVRSERRRSSLPPIVEVHTEEAKGNSGLLLVAEDQTRGVELAGMNTSSEKV